MTGLLGQLFGQSVVMVFGQCFKRSKIIGLFFRFAKYWMDFFNLNIPAILMTYHQMIVPPFLFSNCRHCRRWRQSLERDGDGIATNDATFGTVIRAITYDDGWPIF